MRCRLCGENLGARQVFCSACSFIVARWNEWAVEQYRRTRRWAKVRIDFGRAGANVVVDSSGGMPANEFKAQVPKALANPDAVHIKVMQYGPDGVAVQSVADIAFYLRLKATPGCTSKLDHINGVMHLYIEPDSEAAHLFVSRYLRRRLGPGQGDEAEAKALEEKLTPRRLV